MAWIQQNALALLGGWAALNVVLSAVATQLEPASALGKVVHVLLAIGPLDLLRAWRSATVSLVAIAILVSQTACGASPTQVATGVEIGLNAAVCVLETYSDDVAKGKGAGVAIADAAIKCGVTAAQAANVLAEHRKAEIAEGIVLRPDGGL